MGVPASGDPRRKKGTEADMKRCTECQQEIPPSDTEVEAARGDCYRAAHALYADVWRREPSPYDVLLLARFLAEGGQADLTGDEDG